MTSQSRLIFSRIEHADPHQKALLCLGVYILLALFPWSVFLIAVGAALGHKVGWEYGFENGKVDGAAYVEKMD